jgi:hypothetical protein
MAMVQLLQHWLLPVPLNLVQMDLLGELDWQGLLD